MYIDRRIIFLIIALMLFSSFMTLFSQEGALLSFVLTIPGILIAITFHEFAHAFAADKLGDDTPRRQGRLNLNPFKHLDPFGTIMLIFIKSRSDSFSSRSINELFTCYRV